MAESDWLVPQWPAPAHVKAVFTTRAGGVSLPPFDNLNLGDHVGDAPDAVAANRERLREAIHAAPVFLQQVHGVAVAELDRPARAAGVPVADACLSAEVGQACTIMVADCLPILLTDRAGRWVAAAHAGWRGLAGQHGVGVIESVLVALRARAAEAGESVADADWLAWLGPCIGPRAFEVGPEVREAFHHFGQGRRLFCAPASGQIPGRSRGAGAAAPASRRCHIRLGQRQHHGLVHRRPTLTFLFAPARRRAPRQHRAHGRLHLARLRLPLPPRLARPARPRVQRLPAP